MSVLCTLEQHKQWDTVLAKKQQDDLISILETGHVIYLPNLPFLLSQEEFQLLTPDCLSPGNKNISYNPVARKLKGAVETQSGLLHGMMDRFALHSQMLVHNLFPYYKRSLGWGRTSYRPAEIFGRKTSYRKDDTRLHVDAFTSMPNQGNRILRVFSNVNPHNKPRVWRIGEPFERVAQKFLEQISRPFPFSRKFLHMIGITRSYRTLYDHYMLRIHDKMKADLEYQATADKVQFEFPANSTWIVMTDQVSHAALSGQYLLEQTFSLPVAGMQNELHSPLRVLEKLLGKPLI